jgi:hypothetical protein
MDTLPATIIRLGSIATPQPTDTTPPDDDEDDHKTVEVNSWNYRIKMLLKKIGIKATGYRWMHEQERERFITVDYWFGIIQLILTGVIAALTSTSLATMFSSEELSANKTVLVAITISEVIASMLCGIVIAVKQYNDFNARSTSHKDAAARFIHIYHTIQEQFSLPVKDRENGTTFLKDKIKEYDELVQNMPAIRSKTYQRYTIATKNNDINKPTNIDEFDNIDVNDHTIDVNDNSNNKNTKEKKDMMKYEIDRWLHNF